jgi:hypothetical protein
LTIRRLVPEDDSIVAEFGGENTLWNFEYTDG